jgi:hypothetical protein
MLLSFCKAMTWQNKLFKALKSLPDRIFPTSDGPPLAAFQFASIYDKTTLILTKEHRPLFRIQHGYQDHSA